MNSRIALISANFGSIDKCKVMPSHPKVDTFYFVEESVEPSNAEVSWKEVARCDYPRPEWSLRLRARYFKHQIHRLEKVEHYDYLVWADTSLQFRSLDFIVPEVEKLIQSEPHSRFLLIPHPDRNTIREEYQFISDEIAAGNPYLTVRYKNEKMSEQMRDFQARGWNLDGQLWCATFFIIENSDINRRMFDDWWDQNLRWGLMDQLSLTTMLEKHQINPSRFEVNLWENEFFSYVHHERTLEP